MRNVWILTFAQFHAKTGSKVFSILDFSKVYHAYVYAKFVRDARALREQIYRGMSKNR
jgi:hypothetical protein